jgi:hypothetical protein
VKIINRCSIGIDVKGFEIDRQHVFISRSHLYHVGKRFGGELELGGFTPDELRRLHSVTGTFTKVEELTKDLPAEVVQEPAVQRMIDATQKMRAHLASLPSLELVEQFERETDDGWYLYPRA